MAPDDRLGRVRGMALRIEPDLSGVDIAFLGQFNPAILTPAWFAMHELLPNRVAESATSVVAHRDVTAFQADWLQLHVTQDEFRIHTAQSPYVRLYDLAERVFGEHLHHTPLKALGINRQVHFRVRNMAERDRIGRILAPVTVWGSWSDALGTTGDHGGPTSLTMTQVSPDDRPEDDRINVTVEPSGLVGDGHTGVYVRVNNYFVHQGVDSASTREVVALLKKHFESSIRFSDGIIDHVMSLATKDV